MTRIVEGRPGSLADIEETLARTTIVICFFVAIISLPTLLFVDNVGNALERASRLAIPITVAIAAALAYLFAKRANARLGVTSLIALVSVAIVFHVSVSGLGIRSFSLAFFALAIIGAVHHHLAVYRVAVCVGQRGHKPGALRVQGIAGHRKTKA